jgi:type II restriction enzyme
LRDETLKKFYKFIDNDVASLSRIGEFLKIEKDIYYSQKIKEYEKLGLSLEQSYIKARQSWVNFVGRILEDLALSLISKFCESKNLKVTSDRVLKSKNLDPELDKVKRAVLVHFDEKSLLPDGDLIIYKQSERDVEVKVIISVKNSFRERYTETPYWKLKLAENSNTSHIKVLLITPDNDNELKSAKNPRKGRIVMEHELDGIYIVNENFEPSDKVKKIEDLLNDLQKFTS